jgi:hypothetical protein
MTQADWNNLFDDLKRKEALASDSALAKSLSVSRAFISSIRHGRCSMPVELGRAILARLGRTLVPADEVLFVAKQVKRFTRSIPQNRKAHIDAMRRAKGRCELCGQDAPFDLPDGTPYLELHHIVSLATGGKDTLSNLAVLCPNCHRKMHLQPSDKDIAVLSTVAKHT